MLKKEEECLEIGSRQIRADEDRYTFWTLDLEIGSYLLYSHRYGVLIWTAARMSRGPISEMWDVRAGHVQHLLMSSFY